MIVIKSLEFSNFFSYGENQRIVFDEEKIMQLIGANGAGKSSIPLILEEVLFNKNSKGIDKKSLINRNTSSNKACAEVVAFVDSKELRVRLERTSTTSRVSILFDGEDISGHTATQSYKVLENILGLDHKAFTQLIYQSSNASLEFLTATDSNRKKFLLSLLDLEHYTELHEKVKAREKEFKAESDNLTGQITAYQANIKKLQEELTLINLDAQLLEVPEDISESLQEELNELSGSIANIELINNQIYRNNQARRKLEELQNSLVELEERLATLEKPTEPVEVPDVSNDFKELTNAESEEQRELAYFNKVKALGCNCPTCLQGISEEFKKGLLEESKAKVLKARETITRIKPLLAEVEELQKQNKKLLASKASYNKLVQQIERTKESIVEAEANYDANTANTTRSVDELKSRYDEAMQKLADNKAAIKRATTKNRNIELANSRYTVLSDNIESAKTELEKLLPQLESLNKLTARYSVLAKAFSNNGLPAYEIENKVVDLESACNEYLNTLSAGRFSLTFEMSGDKLQVVISDNGINVGIEALSSGERNRVNVAMLLAIRKLMSSLNKTKINLLILDETIENLDASGKELLVEVLLAEEDLNTVLVSHGYTHPLLSKIEVTKNNEGISYVS